MEPEAVVKLLLEVDPARIEPRDVKVRQLQTALLAQLLDVGHTPRVDLRLCLTDPRDEHVKSVGERGLPRDLLLCDARQLGDVLLYHPILRTDIALKFVLLHKIFIQTHRADLDDLSVQFPPNIPVFLPHRIHFQIYDDVFHDNPYFRKLSAVSDARQMVLQ